MTKLPIKSVDGCSQLHESTGLEQFSQQTFQVLDLALGVLERGHQLLVLVEQDSLFAQDHMDLLLLLLTVTSCSVLILLLLPRLFVFWIAAVRSSTLLGNASQRRRLFHRFVVG